MGEGEKDGGRERGTAGKFLACGRWSSASRRYPGAEVTLYNNSFCFMSWVVYTLRISRDHREAAGREVELSFSLPSRTPPENFPLCRPFVVYDDSSSV